MAKIEGSKTVVVGGRMGVEQQYCGTVGGQSSDFSTMDAEIKVSLSVISGSPGSLGVVRRPRDSRMTP